jgi:hypothetical protein
VAPRRQRRATVQHASLRGPRGTVSSDITEHACPCELYYYRTSCNLPLPVTCELYSSLFILNREHDERSNTCVGTQSECCGVPHIISISFDLVFDDPPAPRAVGAVVGTCMQGSAAPAPRPLVRSQHAIRVHHPSIYCCDHRGQRLDSSNVVNAEHRARFVNKR